LLRFLGVVLLLLAAAGTAAAGVLPGEGLESPSQEYQRPPRDRWLRMGLIWGATAFDLASTRYALANNPATRESNPILAANDGRLRTGVYLGVSLPLDALASYANWKYPHSRSIRILTYVTSFAKFGIGMRNLSQAR